MCRDREPVGRQAIGVFRVAAVVLAVDQLTKAWVVHRLPLGERLPLWPSWLGLRYVQNPGAAFGILPAHGGFLAAIAGLLIVLAVAYRRSLARQPRFVRWAVGLGLGGAAGNMMDRIVRGAVVDFIDVSFWPVFNVADIAIVTATAMMALYIMKEAPDEEPASSAEEDGPPTRARGSREGEGG